MDKEKCVGIGKIVLNAADTTTYTIPHLHFILAKAEYGIEAINLEFGLVASGTTPPEAIQGLSAMLIEYIQRTIATFSYDKLIEVVTTDAMNAYWTEYHRIEFTLAKTKQDIGHVFEEALTRKIRRELMEKYGIRTKTQFAVVEDVKAA